MPTRLVYFKCLLAASGWRPERWPDGYVHETMNPISKEQPLTPPHKVHTLGKDEEHMSLDDLVRHYPPPPAGDWRRDPPTCRVDLSRNTRDL